MEHVREPRDIANRAFDTIDIPQASAKWVDVMQPRLQVTRKVEAAVDTHAKDDQARVAALPKQAR